MKQSDILSGGILFLFGALTALLSTRMPIGTFRTAESGLFPLCLGILLMVLSASFIATAAWASREKVAEDTTREEEPGWLVQVVAFLSVLVLATLFLNTLGYPVVSFLLMVGLLRVLGSRQWPLNLALSLAIAAGSYTLFVYLLKIPLPKGVLGI